MSSFQVGDLVRVARPEVTFGDYAAGDTARVVYVDGAGDLEVEWTPAKDDGACTTLYAREVELVTKSGAYDVARAALREARTAINSALDALDGVA